MTVYIAVIEESRNITHVGMATEYTVQVSDWLN